MKVFAALLAIATIASARNLKLDELEYGFCEGAEITFSVKIELNAVIPEGATVSLKIKREGQIPIPLPCLEINGNHIGSCDYTGDELLAFAGDFLCPDYFPEGQDCKLPLNPGHYGAEGDETATVTLPEIPGILVDLLAAGTYYADATVKYADGSEMTCLYLRVELSGH